MFLKTDISSTDLNWKELIAYLAVMIWGYLFYVWRLLSDVEWEINQLYGLDIIECTDKNDSDEEILNEVTKTNCKKRIANHRIWKINVVNKLQQRAICEEC